MRRSAAWCTTFLLLFSRVPFAVAADPADAAAVDRVDRLVGLLDHPDPRRRTVALAVLAAEGVVAVERLCDLVRAEKVEVRRLVIRRLRTVLRTGDDVERLVVIRGLLRAGSGSSSFVSILDKLGKRESTEVGWLALVVSMRIRGTRDHVIELVREPGALSYLREFDPVRADALAYLNTLQQELGAGPGRELSAQTQLFEMLLVEADPGAATYLAERIGGAEEPELAVWLAIAAKFPALPREIGEPLARRIETGSVRSLATIGTNLAWDRRSGPGFDVPVREAAARRLPEASGVTRMHLLRMLDGCRMPEEKLVGILQAEQRSEDEVGLTAIALLEARGVSTEEDLVERFAALPDLRRRRALLALARTGSVVYLPIFLYVLREGTTPERLLVIDRAFRMAAGRKMLPGLRYCQRNGTLREAAQAVRAAARTDPRLSLPMTAEILIDGLRDTRPEIRARSVSACGELDRITEPIAECLADLLDDPHVAKSMDLFVGNAHRLRSRGRPLVPLLARIAMKGPPEAMLVLPNASAVDWQRNSIFALARIAPRGSAARSAFRHGLRSEAYLVRLFALDAYLGVAWPDIEDVRSVRQRTQDMTKGRELELAREVLAKWGTTRGRSPAAKRQAGRGRTPR